MTQSIRTPNYCLEIGGKAGFLVYKSELSTRVLKGPSFEVDGKLLLPEFTKLSLADEKRLNRCITEYIYEANYAEYPELTLQFIVRVADETPILKFKYRLKSSEDNRLTKTAGEKLDYCSLQIFEKEHLTEVRFSEFNEMIHSFCMNEVPIPESYFGNRFEAMGPLLTGTDGKESFLIAYEHGSQYPDAFLQYCFTAEREIVLSAKKGNYLAGASLRENVYESIWFHFGVCRGDENDMAAVYREFQLKYVTLNLESRKPYIFYNTWCYQERNKWWNGKTYLAEMEEVRMLKEIECAHEMGVDVFVIDTGWYEKTGDWIVNRERFSDGMKSIKEKLDSYGMKLGLWIGPTLAAVTSQAYLNNVVSNAEFDGEASTPGPVWETEDSYDMCIVSSYWETVADTLISLAKELGVSYFKWDSIGQYGCGCAKHHHGTLAHSQKEREEAYAFLLGIYLEKIVDKVCTACPDVIVDFDITEGERSMGLGFLSVGKYFLINNGPYYQNYNIPCEDAWNNIFVAPGAPRTWICRTPLTYDKWIPSVLFLTHYLPDDPMDSQDINLASLILGQNGIWGDLPAVSKEGRARFGEVLSKYKKVRDDITAEAAVRTGTPGAGFECYEKINSKTGKGVVSVFATVENTFRYITSKKTDEIFWTSVPAKVSKLADGNSLIEITFAKPGAAMILFGVK